MNTDSLRIIRFVMNQT